MNTFKVATAWKQQGIATIPILAKSKSPALDSWREYQERLPTERELECWFARPGYNLAVITGWRGLVVLDWDDDIAFSQWERTQAPCTYLVTTARGLHLYYYSRTPTRCAHGQGWDVKAAGGYVLAPPSIHPSGTQYSALGSITDIATIASVESILPGYTLAIEAQRAQAPISVDPFDAAMQPRTEKGAIEAIKTRVHFSDLLGQNGNSSTRVWLTNCPLHHDTHESFAAYPDGHYYCFGCHVRGDVIDLYAAMHHVSIAVAIQEMGG